MIGKLEECEMCKEIQYIDSPLGGQCQKCGWYPAWMPYDNEYLLQDLEKPKFQKFKHLHIQTT